MRVLPPTLGAADVRTLPSTLGASDVRSLASPPDTVDAADKSELRLAFELVHIPLIFACAALPAAEVAA